MTVICSKVILLIKELLSSNSESANAADAGIDLIQILSTTAEYTGYALIVAAPVVLHSLTRNFIYKMYTDTAGDRCAIETCNIIGVPKRRVFLQSELEEPVSNNDMKESKKVTFLARGEKFYIPEDYDKVALILTKIRCEPRTGDD